MDVATAAALGHVAYAHARPSPIQDFQPSRLTVRQAIARTFHLVIYCIDPHRYEKENKQQQKGGGEGRGEGFPKERGEYQ